MKTLIEIHVLQNYAPSNLNRDDTGAPKDAIFGGTRRARISSQCIKRAVRQHFDQMREGGLFTAEELAVRTKRVIHAVADKLQQSGREREASIEKTTSALSYLKLKTAKEDKTQYLLYLGQREIDELTLVVQEKWEEIIAPKVETEDKEKGKKKSGKKGEAEGAPKEVRDRLESLFNGGKAVDLALFGRMLADMPEKNQNAACQVAHAISTHAVEREFDFYTAVDDLKPEDNSGADMMGTVEFNSACFYRYAVIDWEKLVKNLQNDRELAERGVRGFLEGFVRAEPTGKQNTFAAHNEPEFVIVSIRRNTAPRNLANAFEVPIRVRKDESLTAKSVAALANKSQKLKEAYGSGEETAWVLDLTGSSPKDLGESVTSLEALLSKMNLPKE